MAIWVTVSAVFCDALAIWVLLDVGFCGVSAIWVSLSVIFCNVPATLDRQHHWGKLQYKLDDSTDPMMQSLLLSSNGHHQSLDARNAQQSNGVATDYQGYRRSENSRLKSARSPNDNLGESGPHSFNQVAALSDQSEHIRAPDKNLITFARPPMGSKLAHRHHRAQGRPLAPNRSNRASDSNRANRASKARRAQSGNRGKGCNRVNQAARPIGQSDELRPIGPIGQNTQSLNR